MKLKVRYRRPSVLSDPYRDNSEEHLRRILQTPDSDLNWNDFQIILGPYLPAGTYEEAVYFLPMAIQRLHEDDENAVDLVTTPIWFISEYFYELDRDNLLTDARSDLEDCFSRWLSEFRVDEYYVHNAEVIREGLENLVRFHKLADMADSILSRLINYDSDPIRAAWFLEFARENIETSPCSPPAHSIVRDRQKLERALTVVKHAGLDKQSSPSYWENLAWVIAAIP